MPAWLHPQDETVLLDVFAAPRASRTRIVGVHDDRLKIQIAAPPVEGKANGALVRFIADILNVPRAQVEVVGGPTSRRKTVRLSGVSVQRVLMKLTPHRG